MTVTIRKPVHGNFVYIRAETLRNAIQEGALLEINVPAGSGIVNPLEWKKTGKRMEKVFKIKNKPMILYGNTVPIQYPNKGYKEKEVETTESEQALLGSDDPNLTLWESITKILN